MNTNTTLVNPHAAAIDSALLDTGNAVTALWAAQAARAPLKERLQLRAQAEAAQLRAAKLQQEARAAFAQFHGWIYESELWTRAAPMLTHVEYFDSATRRGVALVSHTSALRCGKTRGDIERYATSRDWTAKILPFSWYSPATHTAVLFTAKGGLSMLAPTVKEAAWAMQGAGGFCRVGQRAELWRFPEQGELCRVTADWLQQWLLDNVSPEAPADLAKRVLNSTLRGFTALPDLREPLQASAVATLAPTVDASNRNADLV